MSLIPIALYLGLCYIVGLIGRDRKFGLWGNAAISLVFTPVIGLLIVLASDKKAAPTTTA